MPGGDEPRDARDEHACLAGAGAGDHGQGTVPRAAPRGAGGRRVLRATRRRRAWPSPPRGRVDGVGEGPRGAPVGRGAGRGSDESGQAALISSSARALRAPGSSSLRTNAPSGVRGWPWWSWNSTIALSAHHFEPGAAPTVSPWQEQRQHGFSRACARGQRPSAERRVVRVELGEHVAQRALAHRLQCELVAEALELAVVVDGQAEHGARLVQLPGGVADVAHAVDRAGALEREAHGVVAHRAHRAWSWRGWRPCRCATRESTT